MPPRVQAQGGGRGGGRGGGVSTNANPNGPFNSWLDMGLYDRCITRGIPASMMPAGYGSRYDIMQSPDSVVIRYEMIHEARVDSASIGRPRPRAGHAQYLGDCARLVGRRRRWSSRRPTSAPRRRRRAAART